MSGSFEVRMLYESKCGWAGSFLGDETGQDLVEYALLIAFIALAGAATFIGMSGNTNSIWSAANSRLAAANNPGS